MTINTSSRLKVNASLFNYSKAMDCHVWIPISKSKSSCSDPIFVEDQAVFIEACQSVMPTPEFLLLKKNQLASTLPVRGRSASARSVKVGVLFQFLWMFHHVLVV
ncbi:hypothetical protein KC19_9G134200 [Ceratodon purpureus]|uniref:Uncharacterized protein n=1 Tax=Ceratodon purpureus TaxID=3225 RepID=A0A8T0GVB7_CERPU|nr:hypothetical protein KC19_9G134200 [Ceratodon purpureus]